jgi:uncharacterized protein YcfJ
MKTSDQPIQNNHQPGRARATGRRALASLTLLAGLLVGLPATASAETSYYVMAPVISVDPIVRMQEVERPVQHCSNYQPPQLSYQEHYERPPQQRRFMPSLIGGLVGGLVGNQFGGGNGKKILTVVGALAGSSIANDIARERHYNRAYAQPVRRNCYTTYERENVETVEGYHVVYEYAGQEFSKQVSEHPGDQVRVLVQLSPAGEL